MGNRSARRESLKEIFTRDFLILSLINLSVFFGFQMLNVGLPVYMDQLGAGTQVVGLATTLMTVTATLMRVFSGALLDRFGRMGMLVGGTAVMVCAIFSFAVFPIVGVILGLRLLHGIGWGMGSTASSTIAADIIPKRRFAEGMGYFALTAAIASAVAPAVSIELSQGVGAVYMVYAAAGVTLLALVLAIVQAALSKKSPKPAADQQANTPGASPDQPAAPARPPEPHSKLETLFERRAIVPGILMFLVNIGFGCITTFIALHAQEQGVSGVSVYFLVYAIVTLVTRPAIGKLIDRFGYRAPAILSTACVAGTLALIGLGGSIFMFVTAGLFGGLGIGTAMGTFQTMAVSSVEPWRRGVATSTYMTLFDLGIAVGALVGGGIGELFGYTTMYYIVALSPLIACGISIAALKKGEGAADTR